MAQERTPSQVMVISAAGRWREAACTRLRAAGHDVAVADSPAEALGLVVREPVRAVILDHTLAQPEAFDLVDELRLLSPGIAILYASPVSEAHRWEAVVRAGADALIPLVDGDAPEGLLEVLVARCLANGGPASADTAAEAPSPGAAGLLNKQLARLAHDFNQPLTVVLGTVEMLLLDVPAESFLRQDLLALQREAERLRSLAARLRGLIRPSSH